ncbi:siderophore-interacting protein [Clostridium botulinum]|uniref:Siderophore-interacting protein n=1 Tax=Clostridium botulinum TaxID=1491 RepID=A0ABD7CIC3_CLOBO|nr:siderophore-interacting protein [Clostridium botulinum]KGO12781.1 siderophore-interacting protein [Clostridium botulinum]QRI52865.1 siderophore-interacting protein [Clostridium botulinum]
MNYYKKTENLLNDYIKIKSEIDNLQIEIEDIKLEYKGVGAMSYEEKSTPTNAFNSNVENEIINKEKLLEKLNYKLNKKIRLIKKIDNAINILNDTEKKVIKMKCFEGLQYKQIGQVLNIDHNYACEVKRKAINKIIDLVFIKEKL